MLCHSHVLCWLAFKGGLGGSTLRFGFKRALSSKSSLQLATSFSHEPYAVSPSPGQAERRPRLSHMARSLHSWVLPLPVAFPPTLPAMSPSRSLPKASASSPSKSLGNCAQAASSPLAPPIALNQPPLTTLDIACHASLASARGAFWVTSRSRYLCFPSSAALQPTSPAFAFMYTGSLAVCPGAMASMKKSKRPLRQLPGDSQSRTPTAAPTLMQGTLRCEKRLPARQCLS